ncbi:hypothetical protein NKH18_00875 [Streptomyces sp. M10(2022)]
MDTDAVEGPELVLQGKFADTATRATCSQDSPPADDEESSGSRCGWSIRSEGRAMPQKPPAPSFEDLLDSAQQRACTWNCGTSTPWG